MKILDGKKTYIGIALMALAFLLTNIAKIEVSKEELEGILSGGTEVYEVTRDTVLPKVLALWGMIQAIYGRRVAKLK